MIKKWDEGNFYNLKIFIDMDKKTNEIIVHLINAKGERKHIPYSESIELGKLIKEGKSEEYYADLDWYLSHGYVKMEDAVKRIEGQNGNMV